MIEYLGFRVVRRLKIAPKFMSSPAIRLSWSMKGLAEELGVLKASISSLSLGLIMSQTLGCVIWRLQKLLRAKAQETYAAKLLKLAEPKFAPVDSLESYLRYFLRTVKMV